jgi:hypothetical protein
MFIFAESLISRKGEVVSGPGEVYHNHILYKWIITQNTFDHLLSLCTKHTPSKTQGGCVFKSNDDSHSSPSRILVRAELLRLWSAST